MKFYARMIFITMLIIFAGVYFQYFYEHDKSTINSSYDDGFGSNCSYDNIQYAEGEVFSLKCEDCYCSFGFIECTPVHCKKNRNNLGMDLIEPAIQVLIPLDEAKYPGGVALMNSIVSNSKSKIRFLLVTNSSNSNSVSHLDNWIKGSSLRDVHYKIIPFNSKWLEYLYLPFFKKDSENSDIEDFVKSIENYTDFSMLLPNKILPMEHKVLIITPNMIINGDIAEIYHADILNHTIAAFHTCQVLYSDIFNHEFLRVYNIPGELCTFQASLLLLDLDQWFSQMVEARLLFLMRFILQNRGDINMEIKNGGISLPLYIYFYNKIFDLNHVWSNFVTVDESESYDSQSNALFWSKTQPWNAGAAFHGIWKGFYLPDKTGIFRL